MTIWEKLFGSPERAARTIEDADQIDMCYWMDDVTDGNVRSPEKCRLCMFDYDRFFCERKDMSLVEWLSQEIGE